VTSAPIGLIANPASGKDIRRLVAHASTFDNAEKANIVRRLLVGARAAGAERFLYLADDHHLVRSALESVGAAAQAEPVRLALSGDAFDSERAARAMAEAGCALIVSLGGDGTNRAIVRGWRAAPLIAISTGTNNVFPRMLEGTVAGTAAGLLAAGTIALDEVAAPAKRCDLAVEDEPDDLALIDAALVEGAFTASRAIWDAASLRSLILTRAEADAVGLSAIGGAIAPVAADEDAGLLLEFGEPEPSAGGWRLRAPIAPGQIAPVTLRCLRRLALDETVDLMGPGMLALDGERERRLRPGQQARVRVLRDGPRVIDVRRTLRLAAERGVFRERVAPAQDETTATTRQPA
jgi:hypothetical protein